MADTPALGAGGSNPMEVQVLSPAQANEVGEGWRNKQTALLV